MSISEQPRIGIVSTPRCGNTWLLHALRLLYDVPGEAISTPGELDWPRLPPSFVFQLHWHPTPAFLNLLHEHRFRVVVLIRHPLDCLISILHFSMHNRTEHWLEGEAGDERLIFAAMPRSAAFVDYATSPRTAALFSISTEWKDRPEAHVLRYEDFVCNPGGQLLRLSEALGIAPRRPIEEVVAATTLAGMRERTKYSRHCWKGQPGLWRRLLTAPEAYRIATSHANVFRSWGYECEPDSDLSGSAADAAWTTLVRNNLGQDLAELRQIRREIQEERERSRAEAATAATELATMRARAEAAEAQASNAESRIIAAETRAAAWEEQANAIYSRLEDFYRLGPVALGLARRFHAASVQYPNLRAWLRSFVRGLRSPVMRCRKI